MRPKTILRAVIFWNKRTEDGLKKSIEYFEQAISQDPNFAAAYAGMADSYSILAQTPYLPGAETKALELDPTIAEGHAELALVEFYYDWEWVRSEREFRHAIELNPSYAIAHQWYSYYLSAMGRFPEALEQARLAEQIDPLSLSINTTLAGRYRDLGEYVQAIDISRRTMEIDTNFVPAHIALGAASETRDFGRKPSASTRRPSTFPRTAPRRWRHSVLLTGTLAIEMQLAKFWRVCRTRPSSTTFLRSIWQRFSLAWGTRTTFFTGWGKPTPSGKVKWPF